MRLTVCFILCVIGCVRCDEFRQERGVYVLNSNNFASALKKFKHVFLAIWAPWCHGWKDLLPELEDAARSLDDKNVNVAIAKIQTLELEILYKKGMKKINIGCPSLVFFWDRKGMHYKEPRNAISIVNWVSKKCKPSIKTLGSITETQEFLGKEDESVVGFFEDVGSKNAERFKTAGEISDRCQFGITSNKDVFSHFGASNNQIIFFKQSENKKKVLEGQLSPEEILRFINLEAIPLLMEMNHQTIKTAFGGTYRNILFLFVSNSEDHIDPFREDLIKAAEKYKGKVLFAIVNVNEAFFRNFLEFMRVRGSQVPTFRILNIEGPRHYSPGNCSFTPGSINSFLEAYLRGEIKVQDKGQELPADWNKKPVKILVSSNFDEIVFDKTKKVMVDFYAPWCGPCKRMEPAYNALGDMMKDEDDVVIAKMDATANELSHTKISSFPTLKFYPKDNEVKDFYGKRTPEDMALFIAKNGK